MSINEEVTLSNLWWNNGLRGFLFRDQATETLEELVSAVGGDRDPNLFSDLEDRVEQNYADVEDFEEDCYSESVEYLLENLGYEIEEDEDEDIDGCSGIGAADEDAVREIYLWFVNTRELRERYGYPLRDALVRKLRKGIELSEDYLAKSSVIDNIVRETIKDYAKSFGTFYISPETRKAMKKEIAEYILNEAYDEYEYDN